MGCPIRRERARPASSTRLPAASVAAIQLALAGVAGCASLAPRSDAGAASSERASSAATQVMDDLELFAAVARAVDSAHAELKPFVEIDPRPLKPDPDVMVPIAASFADVGRAAVEARAGVLRRLGIRQVDAAALPPCPGVLSFTATEEERRRNCPRDTTLTAAVGLPRPGGAYFPGGLDEREQGARRGHHAVRVLAIRRMPHGFNGIVYDYVMEKRSGRWRLVHGRSLVWLE
jgi:hypothetical protein